MRPFIKRGGKKGLKDGEIHVLILGMMKTWIVMNIIKGGRNGFMIWIWGRGVSKAYPHSSSCPISLADSVL